MKTILSFVLLIMIGNTPVFSQNNENAPHPILCGVTKADDKITYAEIVKCDELTLPYKELRVKSFVLAYSENGVFYEYNNTGGKFNNEIKEALKTLESQKVKKVLIESVLVIDKDGSERKMRGLNIFLN